MTSITDPPTPLEMKTCWLLGVDDHPRFMKTRWQLVRESAWACGRPDAEHDAEADRKNCQAAHQ